MKIQVLTASALYAALAAAPGAADGLEPGSVLVFPFHQSSFQGSAFTIVSVTNTNLVPIVPNISLGGSTGAHYEYVNVVPDPNGPSNLPLDCLIADRIEFLTPADTRAVLTNCDNAAESEGYLVVSATDPNTFDTDWSHNYLVGSELVLQIQNGSLWYLNAIPFKSPKAQGMPTDMDGDGELDFDGVEYEGIPDELIIDSFVADLYPSLVLINLSGGKPFVANLRFDIFNDNERALSATYAFRCWVEERLVDISQVFDGAFLANNTVNDPTELDIDCDNLDDLETGWARIRGLNHASPVETCPDAALLGALGQGGAIGNIGARRLWESRTKQFDGDFLKMGTDDPECGQLNQPPVCDAGGPYAGTAGQNIQFDGTGSSDPDGGGLTFSWAFGDGASGSGPMPTHAYAAAGDYTVTLTVTDDAGRARSCTAPVDIESGNTPPICDAGGPYSAASGVAVQFDGTGSSDAQSAVLTFAWDFGDGSNGTGPMPTHTYTTPGVYNVMLTVTDGDARSSSCGTTVTITGLNPICNIVKSPNQTVFGAGQAGNLTIPITFNGSGSSDPDGGNIVSFSWDFGDGTGASGPVVMHQFLGAPDGSTVTYTIVLTVTDDEGMTSTCPTQIIVD